MQLNIFDFENVTVINWTWDKDDVINEWVRSLSRALTHNARVNKIPLKMINGTDCEQIEKLLNVTRQQKPGIIK